MKALAHANSYTGYIIYGIAGDPRPYLTGCDIVKGYLRGPPITHQPLLPFAQKPAVLVERTKGQSNG